jgi:hypothetical protein
MRLFSIKGQLWRGIILGLALACFNPAWAASGLPEWGMSTGAAAFMIRAIAIKSPPLGTLLVAGSDGASEQAWPDAASWLEGYEVSLTNVTRIHWDRPFIQYIVYAMDAAGRIQQVHGSEALSEIPVNGVITLITNQVLMQRIDRLDGHNAEPGRLLGVRLRIYDRKNELIQDYAAPWDIMVWQKWNYPLTTEGSGLITPVVHGVRFGG